jgi:hypothetical protein
MSHPADSVRESTSWEAFHTFDTRLEADLNTWLADPESASFPIPVTVLAALVERTIDMPAIPHPARREVREDPPLLALPVMLLAGDVRRR